jgi:hypothetical protein
VTKDAAQRSIRTFYETIKRDGSVKSRWKSVFVIPAKAEIQEDQSVINYLDPGFRRGDDFLRICQRIRYQREGMVVVTVRNLFLSEGNHRYRRIPRSKEGLAPKRGFVL